MNVQPGDIVRLKTGRRSLLGAPLTQTHAFVVVDVSGDGAVVLRDPDDLAGEYLFVVEQDELA